jgi:SAM-dependent methyltransferase
LTRSDQSHTEGPPARPTDAAAYYDDFSLEVGLRDWLVPNARHEQLKLLLADILGSRRSLRILDVGCGAGVMSEYLTAFGTVVATDFSARAVELGRVMAPEVDFRVGDVDEAIPSGHYQLITLFDVLEHIRPDERTALIGRLRSALTNNGAIILSTPHPRHTRWLHAERQDLLQVIDEPVEIRDVLHAAGEAGLMLSRYETFDIDASGPQYQLLLLSTPPDPGAAAKRRKELGVRWRVTANPLARVLRRARLSIRLLRRGMPRAALWFVVGKGRPPRSLVRESANRRDAR